MKEHLKNAKIQEGLVVLGLGLALAVYSLYKFTTAAVKTAWIMSPYLFPLVLAVFTVLIALSLILEGCHELRSTTGKSGESLRLKSVGAVMLLCIVYMLLLPRLGFIGATALFLAVFIRFLGERRIWLVALIAVVMPVALYLIFGVGLSVRLP